jgi:hypothetical protein
VDVVLRCESGNDIVAVLPEPADKVGSDADVERPARAAREDIDARLALFSHEEEHGREGTLKQVQGDENVMRTVVSNGR